MTQQDMPNPVELFEKATNRVSEVVSGIKQDQISASTPCSEWDIRALLGHLIGGAENFAKVLSGTDPTLNSTSSSQSADADAASLSKAYKSAVAGALQAAKAPGALEKKVATPIGEMAGGEFLAANFMDHMVHGWDLAKATGQDTKLDPQLAEACYQMFVPGMADMGREHGVFGAVVLVPDSASTQDKLLAYMGRQP